MNKRKKTNFFNYNKIYLFILLLFATLFSGCGANNEFSTYNGIIVDNPYSPKLNSYKGQLHCHSINSDGNNTPGEVVAAYKNGDGFDKGWIVLYADNKSKEEILNSLKEGNFYASTGNNIKVTVKNNSITATSSNTCLFNFISTGGQILKEENNVTGSEYKIQGNELYIRVKAINISDGTSAWSQPVFITK
ncbi:MAG: hypothetical protein ABRQ38_30795 [Candidatus Eremiobacterota bacterium]